LNWSATRHVELNGSELLRLAQDVLTSRGVTIADAPVLPDEALHLESGIRIFENSDGGLQLDFDAGPHPLEDYAPSFGTSTAALDNLITVVRSLEERYTPFAERFRLSAPEALARVVQRFTPAPARELAGIEAAISDVIARFPGEDGDELAAIYETAIAPRLAPPPVRVVAADPGADDEIGIRVDDWHFAATFRGATVRAMVDLVDLVLAVGPSTRGPGVPQAFFDMRLAGEPLTVRINGFGDVEVVGTVWTTRGPRWIRGTYRRGDLRWSARIPLAYSISPPVPVEESDELDRFVAALLDDSCSDHLAAFVSVGLLQTEHWLERVRAQLRSGLDPSRRRHLLTRERELFAERRAIEMAATSGRYIPLPPAPVAPRAVRSRR
jgi:hypothetical protein